MKLENEKKRIQEILNGCFSDVPAVQGWEILPQPTARTNLPQPSAVAEIRLQDRAFRLLVEMTSIGQPRQARAAIAKLLELAAQAIRSYPVFVAPYISRDVAQICRENDVGYADLAGNCRLAYEGIYILREGRPNPFAVKRPLRLLYQPATSRILRVLLADPGKSWRVLALAAEAKVSAGTVSNVRKALINQEWIEKEGDGVQLKNPKALLDDWAENYSFRKNAVFDFYSLKGPEEIERDIAAACSENNADAMRYALTAFSAAARWAPSVRTNRVFAYISGDIEALAKKLGLKEVPSGANVTLLAPYDDGVFYGSEVKDGLRIVSPVQTYLDLVSYKGRGEEAAEHLLKNVIEKFSVR